MLVWYEHSEDGQANTIAASRIEKEYSQCLRPFCGCTNSFSIKCRGVCKHFPQKPGLRVAA